MEVKLSSVSPVSFMMAKDGDVLEIRPMTPRPGEYRSSIGAPREAFLVFNKQSKIGMIPHKIVDKYGKSNLKTTCRVLRMDKGRNIIIVEV